VQAPPAASGELENSREALCSCVQPTSHINGDAIRLDLGHRHTERNTTSVSMYRTLHRSLDGAKLEFAEELPIQDCFVTPVVWPSR
jgi:hypothetical protein